jgi:hypothetical protein
MLMRNPFRFPYDNGNARGGRTRLYPDLPNGCFIKTSTTMRMRWPAQTGITVYKAVRYLITIRNENDRFGAILHGSSDDQLVLCNKRSTESRSKWVLLLQ